MYDINFFNRVIKNYDLGTVKDFKILTGGYVNLNVKIITTQGTYFFREYLNFKRIDNIRRVNTLLIDLKEKKLPVAKPLKTLNKDNICEIEQKVFSISDYISGTKYDFSEKQFKSAAKCLANFHKVMHSLPLRTGSVISCYHISNINKLLYDQSSIPNKLIISSQRKKKPDLYLIKSMNRFKIHFKKYVKNLDKLGKEEDFSMIHGDFWFGQLIFNNNNDVVGLIDFDEIKIGSIHYDVIKGIRSFIRYPNKIDYDFQKIKDFLLTYKSSFYKIEFNKKQILPILRHSLFNILTHHIKLYKSKHNKVAINVINYHLDELDWIQKNENKIINAFTE